MDFYKELEKVQFDECGGADMELLYNFIERIEVLPNKRDSIPAILKFMEANHDKDFGSPGPLVHFLEEELDYIEELRLSIKRKPTELTLWMANRILNGCTEKQITDWLSVLESISNNISLSDNIRNEAKEFLEYQNGKV